MKSYAQDNEDIFVLDIFDQKKTQECFFFEFGAWDGIHLSNCKLLYDNNWSGCFVEADKKRYHVLEKNYLNDKKIITINEKIDYQTKNINELIQKNNIKKIDLLSIDIDGNDLLIWKSLNIIKPNVVIIEFNSSIPFDTFFEDNTKKNIGSSFLAINNYAKSQNYELIKSTKCNLIYIYKSFNNNMFKEINATEVFNECKPLRIGFNNYGEYLFFQNNELKFEEIFKSPYAKSFISYQPIPKFLRNLTNVNGEGAKFLKRVYSLTVLLLLRPILLATA